MQAYVSGPLTGVEPDPRGLYELAAENLERHGISAYLPHRATDPKLHPHVTPAEVYARDRFHVLSADFVLAFLLPPSLGVGIELELAAAALMPIVALRPRGATVSRMALGVPTRILGPYDYEDPAEVVLAIERALPQLAMRPNSTTTLPAFGPYLRRLREDAGWDRAALAGRIGTSADRITELEDADPRVSNPSLALLSSAARALGAEVQAFLPSPDLDYFAPTPVSQDQLQLPFTDPSAAALAEVER